VGHKVHPKIFRIGGLQTWSSKWFARKDFAEILKQDIKIRKFLKKELKDASVAKVEIERTPTVYTVIIHSGKPGVIIGRGGQGIEDLKKKIKKGFLDPKTSLNVTIHEVQDPNISAELILQSMVSDIEKRMPFRRVMKQSIGKVEKSDAKGIKVTVSGRLNGAEIARSETLTWGSLPLHTIRADIDYARGVANTTFGTIGVKVWVYRGDVFAKNVEVEAEKNTEKSKV
jgi:small subunit ribosomal protein S3